MPEAKLYVVPASQGCATAMAALELKKATAAPLGWTSVASTPRPRTRCAPTSPRCPITWIASRSGSPGTLGGDGRPAGELARRWFGDYAGQVPAGALPV